MFGRAELEQLAESGIAPAEAERQIRLLTDPPPAIRLERPCRIGDGIQRLDAAEREEARREHERVRRAGRILKFVPASGAASRMFKSLLATLAEVRADNMDSLRKASAAGNRDATEALAFLDGLRRFAFRDDLAAAMRQSGPDLERAIGDGKWRAILEHLLSGRGLDYAEQPKGLLLFHRYSDGNRTAFEEHLVEAAAFVRDDGGVCRVHFTVSPEHRARFESLLECVRPAYEKRYSVRFAVDFSVQESATDTLAVDLANAPFRSTDGRLLVRPGGHGALIANLDALGADIAQLQNVDNIVPDHLRGQTLEWKEMLVGRLSIVQRAALGHMEKLASSDSAAVEAALAFLADAFGVSAPQAVKRGGSEEKRAYALERLRRPIRVCGMVPNTGEPGGGPFWVRERDGSTTLQIVESAQVDPASSEQQAVFASSSHFNPVLLACALRDLEGRPFRLSEFVDDDAVFIARKSKDGRDLKALERPGLWNGAMAHWNTVFVEVPGICFAPVKTVNDLLRPEHQPPT